MPSKESLILFHNSNKVWFLCSAKLNFVLKKQDVIILMQNTIFIINAIRNRQFPEFNGLIFGQSLGSWFFCRLL
jgi:hypothetical protein